MMVWMVMVDVDDIVQLRSTLQAVGSILTQFYDHYD